MKLCSVLSYISSCRCYKRVDNLDASQCHPTLGLGLKIVFDQTYNLLHHSLATVVTSGNATLVKSLFCLPLVEVYKTSSISYAIAKHLIKVPFISLLYLTADREMVKELIQHDMCGEKVGNELNAILTSVSRKADLFDGYTEVTKKFVNSWASEKTIKLIVQD